MNEKAARNRKVANRHLNNQVWECTKSGWQNVWRSDGHGRCALKRMHVWYVHRMPPAFVWWLRSRFAGRSKSRKRRPRGGSGRAVCALRRWVAMLHGVFARMTAGKQERGAISTPPANIDAMQPRQRLMLSLQLRTRDGAASLRHRIMAG
ncbi:hypothetical protein [Xanthomonas prunicola]|jgi:hypothetical protein|uniref:hypothetical protein n=1 Tax=Xanthomonas prunicola TaxID=2053930 RepID=UPI001FAE8AB7|nr:hypothetical protein [Xanthomonas prunicola]